MNRNSWLVAACAVLAFAQTLAYYVYLRDDPGNYNGAGASGDQVAYIDLAQQILHGTWQGAVHYMPGLPAVIAAGQVISGDPRLGIALIQAVVYALLVVFAARLARRAFRGSPRLASTETPDGWKRLAGGDGASSGAQAHRRPRAGTAQQMSYGEWAHNPSGDAAAVWAAAGVGLNPALGYYAAQALTEFLTAAALLALVATVYAWSRQPRLGTAALAGLLIGAAAYLRAEYLGLAVVFAIVLAWVGLRSRAPSTGLASAAVLVAVTALAMAPWVVRYTVATGSPALYNESPFSNLVLMGTWFRVFDEHTFAQLQQIETAPGPREEAIARAQTVGPRPDLSQRYMEQSRGPYERPVPETLGLAIENIRLNLRQYLVNHVVLAPVLIWAGHTPVRQADAPRLPASARYVIWGAELALLLLALWQAVRGLWDQATFALSLGFLSVVLFLTVVHVIIAVDERFTTPALPLVGLFAGARVAQLLGARRRVAVGYAA